MNTWKIQLNYWKAVRRLSRQYNIIINKTITNEDSSGSSINLMPWCVCWCSISPHISSLRRSQLRTKHTDEGTAGRDDMRKGWPELTVRPISTMSILQGCLRLRSGKCAYASDPGSVPTPAIQRACLRLRFSKGAYAFDPAMARSPSTRKVCLRPVFRLVPCPASSWEDISWGEAILRYGSLGVVCMKSFYTW